MGSRRVHVQHPMGTAPNLVAAVRTHRHAKWQVGHGFLGLPNRTEYPNCKARQEGSGKKVAATGVCTGACSPLCVTACCALHGNEAASCATGGGCSGCIRVHAFALSVRLLLRCVAQPPATACGVGVDLGGNGGRQRLLRAKRAGKPIKRWIGGEWRTMASGGLGLRGARGDLRYQRKQAWIVRRAVLVVVLAVAAGGHVCIVIQRATLVQEVAGAPVGIAEQVPPVVRTARRGRARRRPCTRWSTWSRRRARRRGRPCTAQRRSSHTYH
jgi:hypothetical protein